MGKKKIQKIDEIQSLRIFINKTLPRSTARCRLLSLEAFRLRRLRRAVELCALEKSQPQALIDDKMCLTKKFTIICLQIVASCPS